ncbi:macrocin o-methyltransferase domain-containing protein [Phaeodactylum tricornutum CCAP 1055/1]|uniref:Macrocin o-methyltransferase domain-containing protein n=1 Tax=Phaeodactylum tricornutum (strain CCAP 1055/1) TaxID=556484 RepID=B7GE77_PHATC|nr:macrocin o-methyltransferase domain-containing protein [Phaeodactylum tricornutum CCAP 1055/1]EEC43105.1 macrocin o-methyltransferase domain-containing protein [Phaeodactylum tricornutum CCAP 1055/1]|eukprot:XP_002185436.1 macrocin o-methyltransferase domain-containing protein [Phaeodactylum tricornutum CCAP 1055/1]
MVSASETVKVRLSCFHDPVSWVAKNAGVLRCCAMALLGTLLISTFRASSTRGTLLQLRSSPERALPCLDVYYKGVITPVSVESDRECLPNHPASDYIQTLISIMVGTPLGGSYHNAADRIGQPPFPYKESLRATGNDWPPFGYTMIGKARAENFRNAIEEVNQHNIPGAVVELGVWRGGAMMIAAAVGKECGNLRELYLFDTFAPIGSYRSEKLQQYLAVPEEDVRGSFRYFDLDGPHVHTEKGLFKDTLPAWKDKKLQIAVLRVDGNFYDSYQDAMYTMYDKVPVGGYVIFDDVMSHRNVMRFWNDFKKEQGLPEDLNRIDDHSAWFRKEKNVKIDWTFFRPPQDANA